MFIEPNEWKTFPSPQLPFNFTMNFYEVLLAIQKKYYDLLNATNAIVAWNNIPDSRGRSLRVFGVKAASILLENYKLRFCLSCDETFLFDTENIEKTLENFNLHSIQW